MDAWIMSIVGVVCLGVLLEIVLPDGQSSKYVKGTFSLLVIFVIASPLPKIVKGDFDFSLSDISLSIDQKYLDELNENKAEQISNDIEKLLLSNEIHAKIQIELDDDNISINKIFVSYKTSQNETKEASDDTVKTIINLIWDKYNIASDNIFVNSE